MKRKVQIGPSCDLDANGDPIQPRLGSPAELQKGYSKKYLDKRGRAMIQAAERLGKLEKDK